MNLDFYCERLTADFWAEPFNAWTNLIFVFVGLWGIRACQFRPTGYTLVLSLISILIGVGSFLFHTFADKATQLLDLIPIFVFTLLFVYFGFRYILKWQRQTSAVITFLFVVMMVLIELFVPKTFVNGSSLYLPALLLMFFMVRKSSHLPAISRMYKLTTLTFFLSLLARTFDNALCEIIPIGTHFIWHLLNGIAVAIMIQITVHLALKDNV